MLVWDFVSVSFLNLLLSQMILFGSAATSVSTDTVRYRLRHQVVMSLTFICFCKITRSERLHVGYDLNKNEFEVNHRGFHLVFFCQIFKGEMKGFLHIKQFIFPDWESYLSFYVSGSRFSNTSCLK